MDDARITTIPLAEDLEQLAPIRVDTPFTITIFGATGDLTHRKLIPALYAMFVERLLPDEFAVVGFARRGYDDASFRAWMADSIREFSRFAVNEASVTAFCEHLYYFQGDLGSPDAFVAFGERAKRETAWPGNHLYYLAVAPSFFDAAVAQLHEAGLIQAADGDTWSRVVLEKPFGHDLDSAHALNAVIRRHLDETQIFRIDHYLGKETVQNILSFRFANAIFEPLFNNHYIERIEITAGETVGMEKGRGAYFDATGCLRDMVQNHMLQLLCLVAMEPPANMTADAIRNEKVKVLQSVQPFAPEEFRSNVIRAQYLGGQVDGTPVPGYTQEDRVEAASRTESYVALRMFINNWRWAGVPFYLRTGKRMQKRKTEIRVRFKIPPLQLFETVECDGDACNLVRARSNILVFSIQPNEGISLRFAAKRPALQMEVENVVMNFSYSDTWSTALPEAYERLLLDLIRGDSTLFTRSDEVEAAWGILDPILRTWRERPDLPLFAYRAGSWGPEEADSFFPDGHGWSNE